MSLGNKKPEFIFETSWEVCNKVGGIHTVISTKAKTLAEETNAKIIFIGPDNLLKTTENPEFIEDKSLYTTWVNHAQRHGFRVRIGHWQIPSKPIAILIDYTNLIPQKDSIFTELWNAYELDSISGGWDFIEPTLFGYAAGQLIESFCRFNLSPRLNVIAHFHEWMTAAGVLYLEKHASFICTMFTTHATIVGRCIASNHQLLYKNLETVSSDVKAHEFNVIAKHSLEKIAAKVADSFTTVSDVTAKECKYFLNKEVDIVTPNGFENDFVPDATLFNKKREQARAKIFEIAEALTNQTYDKNTLIVANSGRYEFRNKGIDLFIEAIAKLRDSKQLNRKVIALILVPANQNGVRADLLQKLNEKSDVVLPNPYITHNIHNFHYDEVIRKTHDTGLNVAGDVSLIFVPNYLNPDDGLFNLSYYDLLIGTDITAFASYYEPWGYTPLESLAFKIPTITTSLAGFGQWIKDKVSNIIDGAIVIERNEDNANTVANEIAKTIIEFSVLGKNDTIKARNNAEKLAQDITWSNFIQYYSEAFNKGLSKNTERFKLTEQTLPCESFEGIKALSNDPTWKKMRILTNIPETFSGLVELTLNVWWSWNYEASQLYKYIDRELWYNSKKNPIILLNNISQERLLELEQDQQFKEMYRNVMNMFHKYMAEEQNISPSIAYFSMEYGLNDNINIYSGGLGILAGDYLKEASDSHVNLTAVGLLYKKGYFTQQLTLNGDQVVVLEDQNLSNIPVSPVKDKDGNLLLITVFMPARAIKLRVWKIAVGRIDLYLLDSDCADNNEIDRAITYQLYGGDWENRLRQEIVLGLGGIRLLKILGIESEVYHLNEGHAAFTNLERMSDLIEFNHLSFEEALEVVRHSSLFTTHTPVPAGHDAFSEELMRMYMRHTPERLRISWDKFMNLGRWTPDKHDERFSMSVLAANTCQDINGVSMLHGKVSRDMFQNLYKGYFPEEIHIGHVTNGVHYPTWTAKEWRQLYETTFGEDFIKHNNDPECWNKIHNVDDNVIWNNRQVLRTKLIEYIKNRYRNSWIKRNDNPKRIKEVLETIDENALTIGFARRFATYKRANLLFNDLDRLSKLLNNPKRPVQFIFAGKAHPNDKPGQDLIKEIVEISRKPEFIGKIIFMENYDIQLAKRLVKGVDIWLNTPTRPLEASGTSGEKATLNGVLNCSVLDGWYLEGYKEGAGWALTDKRTYKNQDFQNELDSLELYGLLENKIIPMFYDRDQNNMPHEWIKTIKNSIAQIAPHYVTSRMVHDYSKQYYVPLAARYNEIIANDYAKAARLATWKKQMSNQWDQIETISIDFPDTTKKDFRLGIPYAGEVVLDLKDIHPDEVGVEVVITKLSDESDRQIVECIELELTKNIDTMAFYSTSFNLNSPGMYEYALRIFPKHPDMTYRMDFNLVRWI
ncbi:MAG: alpha-glucan family phosphorylase [Salinivirgaceae bacterium]|nr:alpha-glucan family phosphorylase [Salinivirgaceae bacterium]MDD4746677.1 alpha-glucan family phosphorylase [Salinivirgaceae bacterium]